MADHDQVRRSVMTALAPPHVATAMDQLIERGCDRQYLLRLFERLRRSEVARLKAKKDLKRLARRLERAGTGVAGLVQWTESGKLGLPDDPESWLLSFSHDLKLLADAIRCSTAASDTRRTDPDLLHARLRIVGHVASKTGNSCDDLVAIVMAAVLGWETYDVAAHVQWRTAHADDVTYPASA